MAVIELPLGAAVLAVLGTLVLVALVVSYPVHARPARGALAGFALVTAAHFILMWIVDDNRLFRRVRAVAEAVERGVPRWDAFIEHFAVFVPMAAFMLAGLICLAWPRPYRDPGTSPLLERWLAGRRLPVLLGVTTLAVIALSYQGPLIDSGYCIGTGARDLVHGRSPYGGKDVCSAGFVTIVTGIPAFLLGRALEVGGSGLVVLPHAPPDPDDPAMFFAARWTVAAMIGLSSWAVWRIGSRDGAHRSAAPCVAWLAFPTTAFALTLGFNDFVPLAYLLLALAYADRPALCMVLLALATQAKFLPAFLLPVLIAYHAPRDRLRSLVVFVVANLLILVAFWLTGHLPAYITVGSKLAAQGVPLSIWGLVSSPLVRPALLAVLLLVVAIVTIRRLRGRRLEYGPMLSAASSLCAAVMLLNERPHPGTLVLPASLAMLATFGSFPSSVTAEAPAPGARPPTAQGRRGAGRRPSAAATRRRALARGAR